MARLWTCFKLHEQGCNWREGLGDPCRCAATLMPVDVEFDVPEGATIREAILCARKAALERAREMLAARGEG